MLHVLLHCCLQGVVSADASYWQSQWQRLKRMMFEAVLPHTNCTFCFSFYFAVCRVW
jgi:hypothetical protein